MATDNLTSDDLHRSGITRWGIMALACAGLAILSANVANLIPAHVIGALHATRVQSGSFNQMRGAVSDLHADSRRLASEYRALQARFNLLDTDRNETIRRLAAVENSLPLLIESLPLQSDIDRSLLTASIAASAPEVYEAQGGTIVVRRSPMFDDVMEQPMPPALAGPVPGR
ncbi:hypothetical protein [Pelagibacterium lacus]|uniref:hypothetical protein n=1 Tax=Pelagibacterium lacus TaxID=2282655 RepID=UPI0011C0809C|nr:hypothetical protein [Pelagibacterium lacus]